MKDLTQGSELKTIFYFSLPILVGNLFQQLYNVADSVIVGNFLGRLIHLLLSIILLKLLLFFQNHQRILQIPHPNIHHLYLK